MQFDSLQSFIAMGGHGLFVWLSFSIALLVLATNVIIPVLKRKNLMNMLRKRAKRESRAQ